MVKAPFKPLRLAPVDIETRSLPDGSLVLRSRHELRPYASRLGELLRYCYVNQRAVLERRAALVEQLYAGAPAPELIIL